MRLAALLLASTLIAFGQNGATSAQSIFEDHCVSCHGAAQMSGLDLRQREAILRGGKRGPALVPGKPDASLLYRAVTRQGDLQMPPGKQALASEEVARLRSWIVARAPRESYATASEASWSALRN